jgi:hypothetical protein
VHGCTRPHRCRIDGRCAALDYGRAGCGDSRSREGLRVLVGALRWPIGDRSAKFVFDGIGEHRREYIDWLLRMNGDGRHMPRLSSQHRCKRSHILTCKSYGCGGLLRYVWCRRQRCVSAATVVLEGKIEMTTSHQALILGSDPAGKLESIVVMEMIGKAARLQAAIARTRADMERRWLKVTVRLDGRPSCAGGKKRRPHRPSGRLH